MAQLVDSAKEKSLADLRDPIWLVWSQNSKGLVSLRSICTRQWIANRYRKGIALQPDVIRAWIEKTICNHLFADMEIERGHYPTPGLLEQTGFK